MSPIPAGTVMREAASGDQPPATAGTGAFAAGIPAAEVLDAKQAQVLARPKPLLAPAPNLDEHGADIRKNGWTLK